MQRENAKIKLRKGMQWSFILKIDTNAATNLLDKLNLNNTSFDRIQFWPQPKDATFSIVLLREDQDRLFRDVMAAGGRTLSRPQLSGDVGEAIQ